jgi:hypothetical protein
MSAKNLLRIASEIEKTDPILAYELEKSVLALSGHSAAINPGAKKFEEHIESMIGLLKSVKSDLKKSLEDFETAEEFAKFFKEGALDEELKSLQDLLKRAGNLPPIPRAAGIKDWIKKLAPGKKKPKETTEAPEREPEESGMSPSYRMDESTMDEFVEGKSDWADPGHYIEQEARENKEFFGGAKDLIKEVESIRKKPDKTKVKTLMDQVDALIRKGGNLLKGLYKHLEEPATKVDLGEGDEKKPGEKKPAEKKKVFNLEGTVDHYADMLKESAGDEKKVISLLKELFKAVEPALESDQVSLASRRMASVLIKTAYLNPRLQSGLMPLIKKAMSATIPSRSVQQRSA